MNPNFVNENNEVKEFLLEDVDFKELYDNTNISNKGISYEDTIVNFLTYGVYIQHFFTKLTEVDVFILSTNDAVYLPHLYDEYKYYLDVTY